MLKLKPIAYPVATTHTHHTWAQHLTSAAYIQNTKRKKERPHKMNEKEKEVLNKVIKEMKNAQGIIHFWLPGTPIDTTFSSWIQDLEGLLND